ncbi:peptidoglycan editing factor PgeF [Paenibacillus sacheonensis]|uniref:Purine nucleoside phosphorylase n=1 Tax=Paenibacillus sacheonensis TaxID=742054 RepID=A0A7X4YTD0_9BACL|nr:peptidoglycan editing factor PgeF [Paenibacillus sacheonensis]MBM7565725.1 YfiH family protein [Paenibacillus sacheonensis]NBC72217.1 peptidoglycan editing factor PgeF [Paenibacillus sacheonensis]
MESFVQERAAKKPSLFLLSPWAERYRGLTAGFTGRHGGVSSSPWTSLNCGLHVGDADEDVTHNRRMIAEALGWPFEAWTCAEQVHGDRVLAVTLDDRGKGRESRRTVVGDADAMMTNERNVLLTSFYADCVPLYFYDPKNGVIALAHAGWKGTVLEIARKTTEAMAAGYGSEPADIQAAIGPSIGLCCYEVNEVVLDRVIPLIGQMNLRQEEIVVPTVERKARINLKELNRQIMIKAGILPSHIECSEWCTGCATDLFFSHRMEGGATGRMVSWIGMSEGELKA